MFNYLKIVHCQIATVRGVHRRWDINIYTHPHQNILTPPYTRISYRKTFNINVHRKDKLYKKINK